MACDAGGICAADGGLLLSNNPSTTIPGPSVGEPALSVSDASANEADGSIGFAVTLSAAASATVTVDYATADGTATAGADYTSTSGTLTFQTGDTQKTISVPIIDDSVEDDGETFTLTLSNASGATLADAEATGTIHNTVATAAVSVPVPLTASFTGVPASHDGANVFTFNLSFNEPVAVSYKVLRDQALSASTGKVDKCRRVDGRNDLWEVHIEPRSNADITVTLSSPSSDCDDKDAVCTADDKLLSNEPSATIAGPSAKVVAASGPPGLAPNAPNPFNASTLIPYRLAMSGAVRLEIYNLLGQPMRTLVDQVQDAGVYLVPWDARDQRGAAVAAGVYLVRLQYPGGVQTRRLLYLK